MATTTIPTNCAAVEETLLHESGRLGPGMFARNARMRPIIRLQSKTRGAWQNGMGVALNAVTFERAFPALTGDPWTIIAASDGDTANACRPPSEVVTTGQTVREYKPRHYSVNSEDYCIRDVQTAFDFRDFLTKVTRSLTRISEWVWYRRYITDYRRIAGHHITLNDANETMVDSGEAPADAAYYNTSNLATGALSQGVLDNIYMDLYREGGDFPSGNDVDTGEPVFSLITSAETSRGIIRNNSALRDDVRYAFMGQGAGSPLIGGPTKRRNYGGFMHEIDPYPPRYILTGGAYVEVPAWIKSDATKGDKWEQNPAYKAAPFEESFIWHEDNYQSLAVNTISNPAPGWNFDARTWQGEFSPRNIIDRTCNPDGLNIFMRALYADAAKPLNPAVGWTILHARCGFAVDLKDCYGTDN